MFTLMSETEVHFNNSEEISTGTTIMAFKYKDGIIVAADSRTSSGTLVASRITDKLTQITPNIFCCRSGSAADTQAIVRIIQKEIKYLSEVENSAPSVFKTAKMISQMIYKYDQLLAGIIVAGVDEEPRIFKINVCGSLLEENISLGGSGSGFIYGFCDSHYKPNMSLEESLNFAKSAVRLAIRRDNSSGGVIRIAAITKEGVKRYFVSGEDSLDQ